MTTTKQLKNYRNLKRRILKRKRRQKFFQSILKKWISLWMVQKILRKVWRYLALFYLVLLLGYKTGHQQQVNISDMRKTELIQCRKDLKHIQSMLEQQDFRLSKLNQELIMWQTKNSQLENHYDQVLKELSQTKSENLELIQDLKSLESETDNLKTTKTNLNTKLGEFQKILTSNKKELKTVSANYEDQLKKLNERIEKEKTLRMEKISEFNSLSEQKNLMLKNAQTEIDTLKFELEKVKLEKMQFQSEIQFFQQKLDFEQRLLEEKTKDFDKKQAELELQIVLKKDEIKGYQMKLQVLETKLEDQEKLFTVELEEIRNELKTMYAKMETLDSRNRVEILLRLLDQLLIGRFKFR